ncbi:MAG: hypothetical protein ABI548_16325 [Polyangiaceae bacterium]
MKANFRNSFAKRSLVIAATALPSLYAGLSSAQAAAPPAAAPPPVAAAPAPLPAAPPPPAAAPAPMPEPAPAVVTPPASETPPAPPSVPPPDPMAEKYKHIDMGIWSRTGFALQSASNPKKLNGLGMGGELEVHFSNQMRKSVAWTANLVANYGAGDGNSFTPGGGSINGTASILDLIAQFEPDPAFNLWVGRMLVASDRSNFSGPYFTAPWIYPLKLGPQSFANAYAVVGPKEGPSGRNDGATIWGGFNEGLFKYYLGVYNLHDAANKPLVSGRLALSLLSGEPGYYGSSTYYGKDVLAIGVGGQYQKNGDGSIKPAAGGALTDYGMFLADLLFEKNLAASGVFDVEGAFYKYVGDGEPSTFSTMALVSYLTPDVGIGKLQPLVRFQQAKQKSTADGGSGNDVSMIDAQLGLVVDSYATRFALGFTHASDGGALSSNAVFAGVQLMK